MYQTENSYTLVIAIDNAGAVRYAVQNPSSIKDATDRVLADRKASNQTPTTQVYAIGAFESLAALKLQIFGEPFVLMSKSNLDYKAKCDELEERASELEESYTRLKELAERMLDDFESTLDDIATAARDAENAAEEAQSSAQTAESEASGAAYDASSLRQSIDGWRNEVYDA